MNSDQIKNLQHLLNRFTSKYLKYIPPLRVDGEKGHATNERIKTVKYYLGYAGKRNRQNTIANKDFRHRVRHPKSLRFLSAKQIARGLARRSNQRRRAQKNHNKGGKTQGVGTFDGIRVANWLIPYLQWARAHGWRGWLVSGWRDPVYSERLCYNMCGRPSCPGRCAGRSSNHSGSTKPRGAIDVSDYVRFGQLMKSCPIQPRIFNALGARDPVHFSSSGN